MVAVLEYNGPGAQTRWLQVGCEKQCREIALESLWKPRLNHRTVYRWSPLVFCFARGFRLWHSLVWPRLWYGRCQPQRRCGTRLFMRYNGQNPDAEWDQLHEAIACVRYALLSGSLSTRLWSTVFHTELSSCPLFDVAILPRRTSGMESI